MKFEFARNYKVDRFSTWCVGDVRFIRIHFKDQYKATTYRLISSESDPVTFNLLAKSLFKNFEFVSRCTTNGGRTIDKYVLRG